MTKEREGKQAGDLQSVVANSHTVTHEVTNCRLVIYAAYQPKCGQTGKDKSESEACDWASADEDERWEMSTHHMCSLLPCGFVSLEQFYPHTPPGFDTLRLEGWQIVALISP